MLSGEQLPLSTVGSRGEKLPSDRLVVVGQLPGFYEVGNEYAKLQLDSGTPYLLLCCQVTSPWVSQNQESFTVTGGVLRSGFAAEAHTARLRLGERFFNNITVVVPVQKIPSFDVDGFLPTSLFSNA